MFLLYLWPVLNSQSFVFLFVPFPLFAVSLPRRWITPAWPGIPTAHQWASCSWAGPCFTEEPVRDWKCARLRVPFSHLSSQGQHPNCKCMNSHAWWFFCKTQVSHFFSLSVFITGQPCSRDHQYRHSGVASLCERIYLLNVYSWLSC